MQCRFMRDFLHVVWDRASESPTMLLERRIIWPYPRCVESETLGETPSDLCSKKLPGASNAAAT